MFQRPSTIRAHTAALLAGMLASCQSLPSLPHGTASAMNSADTKARAGLAIVPTPFPAQPSYAAVTGCLYRHVIAIYGGKTNETQVLLTAKRVRDRLLITTSGDGKNSTLLIGRNGTLYDFNTADLFQDKRVSPETFEQSSREQIAAMQSKGSKGVHVINELTAIFPQYVVGGASPDAIVASVAAEGSTVWANYLYRGRTTYQGVDAAVLDLVRAFESVPSGTVTVGYNVVDLSNMMPILFVLDAGNKMRFERISCQ